MKYELSHGSFDVDFIISCSTNMQYDKRHANNEREMYEVLSTPRLLEVARSVAALMRFALSPPKSYVKVKTGCWRYKIEHHV